MGLEQNFLVKTEILARCQAVGVFHLCTQIQNGVLKAGSSHARYACPNHKTAVPVHERFCMKSSKVDFIASSLRE